VSRPPGGWEPPPEPPTLAPGIVHIWRADLDGLSYTSEVLSAAELARAERFRFEVDRRRWKSARTVLRMLLAMYLGIGPRSVEITTGEHGKPTLNTSHLQFNLSHSEGLALYAFAIDNPVGIDVEVAGRPIDEAAVALAIPSDPGATRVKVFRESERQRELLRVWVRNEAVLKCLGTGLGAAPDHADVSGLWLVDLDVGSWPAAALAVAEPPRCVRTWEWSWPLRTLW
jgi:4'-phosphopantetheinyl transferase